MRGRLAPSPTGNLHLGNAFAFLLAWLSAAVQKGALVLRLEDIDPDRSRAAFVRGILEDLAWLGLTWDEGPRPSFHPDRRGAESAFFPEEGAFGPYRQSARLERYEAVLQDLRRRNLLYPCFCTRRELRLLASAPHSGDEGVPYPGICRRLSGKERTARLAAKVPFSLRLDTARSMETLLRETPGATEGSLLSWNDAVHGPQVFTPADCGGDFALRRSDGVFAYQLAVAVDDAAMDITEVVRGEDLLSSTPRQILLLRLLGAPLPRYAHIPLLRDAQGQRLAKRHKGLEVRALREAGFSPEAVIGRLAHLAGLRATPAPVPPAGLAEGFSFAFLRGCAPVADFSRP
ncbi:MAG: tRNA glutamyl-Q(34) synthetase GluQRS [Desulfovibrio sp.]|jgi:glutamyl-tRNA synthetase|nr:tRNA glutamyl-Q(34) synthetase GluQRS [Desulfovibrio sp.]